MRAIELHNRPPRDVKLIVGPSKSGSSVKEVLLLKSSPFFLKILTGGYSESASGIIHLPDDKPEVVELYISFLKFRSIRPPCSRHGKFPMTRGPESFTESEFNGEWAICNATDAFWFTHFDITLMEAYVFADKILDYAFADAVLFALADADDATWFSIGCINYVYDRTEPEAEVRSILRPIWLSTCLQVLDRLRWVVFEPEVVKEQFDAFIEVLDSIGYCKEFLADLQPAVFDVMRGHAPGYIPGRAFPASFEERRRAPTHRGLIDTGDVELPITAASQDVNRDIDQNVDQVTIAYDQAFKALQRGRI